MRYLWILAVVWCGCVWAEAVDPAASADNEKLESAAKELITAQQNLAEALQRWKTLRSKPKPVAKDIKTWVDAADKIAGMAPAAEGSAPKTAPEGKIDLAARRTELRTAAETAMNPAYAPYLAMAQQESAMLKQTEAMLRQQYTAMRPNMQGQMQQTFDGSGFSEAYNKAMRASQAKVDPLYRAVEKAREDFLRPFRNEVNTQPTAEAAKQDLLIAVQVAQEFSQRKH